MPISEVRKIFFSSSDINLKTKNISEGKVLRLGSPQCQQTRRQTRRAGFNQAIRLGVSLRLPVSLRLGSPQGSTLVLRVVQGGGGGGVAQLVVVPLAMGRGAKSPGFDSHRGLSFQKGREDGWIGLNPPPGFMDHRRVMHVED